MRVVNGPYKWAMWARAWDKQCAWIVIGIITKSLHLVNFLHSSRGTTVMWWKRQASTFRVFCLVVLRLRLLHRNRQFFLLDWSSFPSFPSLFPSLLCFCWDSTLVGFILREINFAWPLCLWKGTQAYINIHMRLFQILSLGTGWAVLVFDHGDCVHASRWFLTFPAQPLSFFFYFIFVNSLSPLTLNSSLNTLWFPFPPVNFCLYIIFFIYVISTFLFHAFILPRTAPVIYLSIFLIPFFLLCSYLSLYLFCYSLCPLLFIHYTSHSSQFSFFLTFLFFCFYCLTGFL